MTPVHRARITWTDACVERGLPVTDRVVDPAWFADAPGPEAEAWSLVCEFGAPPRKQGNPSIASVRFLVEEAPHARLVPGARLYMFERATSARALVEILE